MPNTNRLSRTNRPDVTCIGCGKLTTRNAGSGNTCRACYDAAGLEIEHADSNGTHYGAEVPVKGCPRCSHTK